MVLVTPSYDIFLLSILTMFKYINTRVLKFDLIHFAEYIVFKHN